MKTEDFIDTAIIALAAASADGTSWASVVKQAHELNAARLSAAPDRTPRIVGQTAKEAARADVRTWVLTLLEQYEGRVYGGAVAIARRCPLGRERCRVVIDGLVSEGVVRFEQHRGRKSMVRNVQGVAP